MPIESCQFEGKSGFRWGQQGKCYTYEPDAGPEARDRARQRAMMQARAIQSQHLTIAAGLQHMSPAEVAPLLDRDLVNSLKRANNDTSPTIKIYAVGHEGEAEGRLVGTGKRVFKYLQHAIRKLHDRLQMSTPVFDHHGATNDHASRVQIGEVVGKAIDTAKGIARALAAVYLYPQYRDRDLDVASIEADLQFSEDESGTVYVEDLPAITGIALSHHSIDSPGFPGATLLGAIQAFRVQHYPTRGGDETMTREELIAAISAGKYTAEDLFGKDVILSLACVKEYAATEKKTEYEHAKRVERTLGEERQANMEAKKKFDDDLALIRSENIKLSRGGMLESTAVERKLDAKQKAFIQRNLESLVPKGTTPEAVKVELNTWIDQQLVAYADIAKLLGVPAPEAGGNGTPRTNYDAAGQGGGDAGEEDLTNPKYNPLIPTA